MRVAFFLSMVSAINYVQKVTVEKLVTGFSSVTSNHTVTKYWASANLLLLIKINQDWFLLRSVAA